MLCDSCSMRPATMKMVVGNAAGQQKMLMLCGLCAHRFTNVMRPGAAAPPPKQSWFQRAFGPSDTGNGTAPQEDQSGGQAGTAVFDERRLPTNRQYAQLGFSPATQESISNAQKISRTLGFRSIGTFQLLMGLCAQEGVTRHVLEHYGVTLDRLWAVESESRGKGAVVESVAPRVDDGRSGTRRFGLQKGALAVLNLASSIAIGMSSPFIEPEHLALAVIEVPDTRAANWMMSQGVNMGALKTDLVRAIGYEARAQAPRAVEMTLQEQLTGAGRPVDQPSAQEPETADSGSGQENALAKYSRDLTELARRGDLMPVIGREAELARVEMILARMGKNNPMLLGDPGVGKTAVVEALAQHIVSGQVPSRLSGCHVYEIDLASLLAGTEMRGQFEQRLENLISQVSAMGPNAILFIDESHMLVGAGASEGTMDAGNILKPALARGELHLIGATTKKEYDKYIEKDPALARRFQPVLIGEPTIAQCIEILDGIHERFEKHHGVTVSHEALEAAVTLSNQYLTDRFLPDKAIDLIDVACSAVSIENEKTGQSRSVVEDDIAGVISEWTGIPLHKMIEPEKQKLLKMEEILHERIINQEAAVSAVARVVKRSRAGLNDPHKPNGCFIFAGPTGVGKTELARALAEFLFDDDDALVRIDMSEYMEKDSVSKLIGASPGLVGYEEGGQLTGKVRFKPYSVVLFDEMEKAHPRVLNLLLQVADAGTLTDAQGRAVNFRNTIIILTSNVGADLFYNGSAASMDPDALKKHVTDLLVSATSPELVNRMDAVVVFTPLNEDQVEQVVKLQLNALSRRLGDQELAIEVTDEVLAYLASKGYDPAMGARPAKRIIQDQVVSPLSDMILMEQLKPGGKAKLHLVDGALRISPE